MSGVGRLPSGATPGEWAEILGVSVEAIELYLQSEVIDLHVDSFIWTRLFGYDLSRRHGAGPLGGRYFSQADFPRMREANIAGALWSITTNPLRRPSRRAQLFAENRAALQRICEAASDQVRLVRTEAEYRRARNAGRHAVMIAIQGGNALDGDEELRLMQDGSVLAVTLVHLSRASLGQTSSPLGGQGGLTHHGRAYVERLNALRVFVDLAHISPRGFWDAIEVHDRSQPLLVSHTGVSGVLPHWRNIDDEQLKAVADRGGVVGVIFHGGYLGGPYWSGGSCGLIADHLAHIVRTIGDEHAALGSDWDGAIITPRDMPTCLELPRLVQALLDRGVQPAAIQKILGQNFLRAWRDLRPETGPALA